ncbi:MAG: hypothetical protein WCI34_08365, partial [Actinomycetes bacterium]
LGLQLEFCDFWYRNWKATGYTCSLSVSGIMGRQHWKTSKGIRVGDSLKRLRRAYPGARRHGAASWWLSKRYSGLGGYYYPPAAAAVRAGRISRLSFSSFCES